MINLVHGDCMKHLVNFKDNEFDLAICDPPYGIDIGKRVYGKGKYNRVWGNSVALKKDYGKCEWDKSIPDNVFFAELIRVSKEQVIWGGNHFQLPLARGWVFWDKLTGGNDFSDGELAWTSFDKPLKKFTFMWNGMLQGAMSNKETRIHPTQKPVKLYEWLLKNYAKQGDRILDTHGGSFSLAIACYNLDFDLTLFEIDEDYYRAGVERFENHKKQIRLFGDKQ